MADDASTLTRVVSGSMFTVSAYADPEEIADEWAELEAHGALTPFQTRAWLLPWLRFIAPICDAQPIFVLAREAPHGRPLMLWPLCRQKLGSVATIQFQDLGVSDYNAPLRARGFEPSEAEFQRLWKKVLGVLPKADLIQLEKMPETICGDANPMARLSGAEVMRLRAWELPLPPSRDAYDKFLRQHERKELRRKRRNLETEGPLQFEYAQSEGQARRIFDALCGFKVARGMGELLAQRAYVDFYFAVIAENLENGFGLLSELRVGDETGAALYALNHRNRYFLLMHGFGMNRWGSKSPGIVAIDYALSDRIAAGSVCLDFTIGNEQYKQQFGVEERYLRAYEHALSLLGQCVLGMHAAKRFVGRQIRRLPKRYWPKGLRP